MAAFNLHIHLIELLVGKRILIDKVTNNHKKDGGNDGREPQNGILCDFRVVG